MGTNRIIMMTSGNSKEDIAFKMGFEDGLLYKGSVTVLPITTNTNNPYTPVHKPINKTEEFIKRKKAIVNKHKIRYHEFPRNSNVVKNKRGK